MKKIKLTAWIVSLLATSAMAQTMDDGLKQFDYENFASARKIFQSLIQKNASDARNYYYLGQVYENFDRNDSARIVFNQGIQADPKSIWNVVGLGQTYLSEGNSSGANDQFSKAKSMTTSKDVTYYWLVGRAYLYSMKPNPQAAADQLQQAVQVNFNSKNAADKNMMAEVKYELGNAYAAMNRFGDAVNAYEDATSLNPNMAKAFTKVGTIWHHALNYNQSIANFESALKIDPNFAPALRELAELYYATGQFDKAKDTFAKYLNVADKDDDTQFRYAQFLFVTKDYQGALNKLNELKRHIDKYTLWRMLAYSNFEIGNYEEGMRDIDTFFHKVDTTRIISSDYEYDAKLLNKLNQDSLAILEYRKTLTVDTTKWADWSEIGNILFKDKKYPEAATAYLMKVKARPSAAGLQDWFNVGKSYYFANQFQSADSAFANMSKLNKTWPIPYLWRARSMTNLDNPSNPDSAKGLAAPYYQAVIYHVDTAMNKYSKELKEAYKYLGNFNALKSNYGASLYYFDQALKIDPNDPDIPKTVQSVKALYKGQPGQNIQCTKDSAGNYIVNISINGANVAAIYDPLATGVVVNTQGDQQLFNGGNISKADAKIGDRSAKNVMVSIDTARTVPITIGADVLNKMNIVLDSLTGNLLLR